MLSCMLSCMRLSSVSVQSLSLTHQNQFHHYKINQVKAKVFINLLMSALFALTLSAVAETQGREVNPFGLTVGLFAISLLPKGMGKGVLAEGISVEIWESRLAENIYRGHPWIARGVDRSANVLNGSVVHIPQAGAGPGAQRNRTKLPAQAVLRKDTDITYAIDEFTTDPSVINDAAKVELAYDKLASEIFNHTAVLRKNIAIWMAYRWAQEQSGYIINSTGANYADHAHGLTGNRKKPLISDIGAGKEVLQSALKMQEFGGIALMTTKAYKALKEDTALDDDQKLRVNGVAMTNAGEIQSIRGFEVVVDDDLVIPTYDASNVLKSPDAQLTAATDNDSIQLIVTDYVHQAVGTIKFFERLNDPSLYGDSYSALVRAGGRKEYADGRGVCAISIDA